MSLRTKKEAEFALFTVCNLAYLPKALVLAESALKFNGNRLKIFLIDRKVNLPQEEALAEFIWIEDLSIPNFNSLAFKYDITELSTSLKPWITLKLLNDYQKVIFLDPDTCLYHSVDPILKDLDKHAIVLTPHYTTPQPDTLPESDVGMMRFGSFNLGFYAVKKTNEGLRFLNWWSDRCLKLCYFETQFGLSTDQKWVSIAPCFFQDLHVSFHLGYNVAMWNLFERSIEVLPDNTYLINKTFPLIFFHFSSFDMQHPELLSKRPFIDKELKRTDFLPLSLEYRAVLQRKGSDLPPSPYGFDYMSNGDYISPTLRRAYAAILDELPPNHDPFDSQGPIGQFAQKNHLLEKKHRVYRSESYGDMPKHRLKFSLINGLMRLLLRLIGPNQFMNFSRLLVYLSSYRLNKDLWKR